MITDGRLRYRRRIWDCGCVVKRKVSRERLMYGLVEWDTTVALRPCGRRDMALSGALLCALCRSVLGKEYCSVFGSDSERRSDSRGSASGRNIYKTL